jgi:GT2 family glycosyltransferase
MTELSRPVAADSPVVSVVIPTLPQTDQTTTVESLTKQTIADPYELIVVSSDTLDRSEARNKGLDAAQANVVAFTDDDTVPPCDWVESVSQAFASTSELICVEGPVSGGISYRGTRFYLSCNLAVDRDAARAVGGFDSTFAGWREDTEFGWRMERDGNGDCRYDPTMEMAHPSFGRSSFDPDCERRLRARYPERYRAVHSTFTNICHRLDRPPLSTIESVATTLGVTDAIHQQLQRLRWGMSQLRDRS